jgi:hypothetical protein
MSRNSMIILINSSQTFGCIFLLGSSRLCVHIQHLENYRMNFYIGEVYRKIINTSQSLLRSETNRGHFARGSACVSVHMTDATL